MLQLRTFHAKNKLKEAPQPTQNKFVSQITKTQTLTVTNRRNSKGEFTLNLRELSFSCLCRVSSTEKIMRRDGVYTSNNTKHKSEAKAPCTQAKHTQFEAKQDTNPKQNDKAYTSETHPIQSKTRQRQNDKHTGTQAKYTIRSKTSYKP